MNLILLAVISYVVYTYVIQESMTNYDTITIAVVGVVWALITIGLIVYVLYI